MRLINHNNEQFELRIQGCEFNSNGEKIEWWFKSSVIITTEGIKRKTNLKFLTIEDLDLLIDWIRDISNGNYEKTFFQFVDSHVWFRVWRKGKEPILRFFIQGDKYRKFYWDWRLKLDKDKKFLKYAQALLDSNR